MGSNVINDYEIKERKLIKCGKQKTLTSNGIEDNIDWDKVSLFGNKIKINKVIESNDNEFEAVIDSFSISYEDFDYIKEIGLKLYGKDCKFSFNAESKWNISFAIKR